MIAVLAGALAGSIFSSAQARQSQPAPSATGSVAAGRKLYQVQCAYCHGASGKGNGEASYILFPRPRDLTSGQFRLRSTPKDSLPSDEDLLQTITRGIPGSGMPGFAFLREEERHDLVEYVKTLSPKFASADGAHGAAIDLRGMPAKSAELIAGGKAVFVRLQCASCHGAEGKGDGEAVKALEDDAGLPVYPRNFTTGPFKGGASVSDIFLRITTGLEGTPMTSYAEIGEAERWQLAYYVQSLCKSENCGADSSHGTLMSARARGHLPVNDPLAAAWKSAPSTPIRLISLWNRGAQIPNLVVRSLNDGHTIAFLLEWDDATRDVSTIRPQDFRDSIALQLFAGNGYPPISMGDSNSEVTIWQWKADWQEQINRGRRMGPRDAHPNMVEPSYPGPGLAALEVGNQNALTSRFSPVEEATARGFGTITPKPQPQQHVAGQGMWRDGKWHVVVSRRIEPGSGIDIARGRTKLGFAIWNGNESQRNGEKAISNWYALVVGKQ
jgi:mono/diheme cytochrome c family protein